MEKQILEEKIKEIQDLREHKGKEDETFEKIDHLRLKFEEKKHPDKSVTLYWEESLLHQHLVMSGNKEHLNDMEEAALKAHKLVEKYNLERLQATSHRFLGRVHTYNNNHDKAQKEYEKSIEYILKKDNQEQIFELNAFLSHALIMNGKTEEGLELAKKTYDEMELTYMAQKLKEKKYVVWAVWRSGIWPRTIEALKEMGANFDKDVMSKNLDDTEDFLKNPRGEITWGDDKFQFKLDKISEARKLLSN